ncbi:MAG: HypC/HybG/HupF family hydrogenase formation chaperone [Eubacterium sp.]|nr:HypC/HybG/HupF family hydrogenase formation chaperone [Eubacterium sp.]
MCVALPGKVIEVKGNTAVVDFSGNRVEARSGLVEIEPGDRVLVHAGLILQKVSQTEAEEMEMLFRELEDSVG